MSYWIIKPAAATLKKQKRFISEAGHELKTPLTVISAGVELLQKKSDNSDNEKWLKHIKEQVDKMSVMTAELLALSKIDEDIKATKTEFDLSQTILTESLAFECVAFENGKTLECKTENGLMYKGNYQAVCQAIGILCDNAVKYANPNNIIEMRLKKQFSKIVFSVSNESDDIIKDEINLVFERFYRDSESRAKTSGTGLGLAILKTLAKDKLPMRLSGGQKQRVAIARASASNPTMILADEPTGNLDKESAEDILNILKEIALSGKLLICVTHSERVASACTRVLSILYILLTNDAILW